MPLTKERARHYVATIRDVERKIEDELHRLEPVEERFAAARDALLEAMREDREKLDALNAAHGKEKEALAELYRQRTALLAQKVAEEAQ